MEQASLGISFVADLLSCEGYANDFSGSRTRRQFGGSLRYPSFYGGRHLEMGWSVT